MGTSVPNVIASGVRVPELRFISLFVPDLAQATAHYAELLQMSPSSEPGVAPSRHPFAVKGPVVFQLGGVALALYECDGSTTHPGDVGLGLENPIEEAAGRLRGIGGMLFWGPGKVVDSETRLAIGVTPDRHFFEFKDP